MDRRQLLGGIAALAAAQDGFVSLDQCWSVGATPGIVHRWVAQGRLERCGVRGVHFPGQPPNWRRDVRAALAVAGPSALVSHRAAGALHGFEGFLPGPVEVLAPRSARNRTVAGLLHTSTPVAKIDRCELDGLPATSAARTIIDLASRCNLRELERAIDSAVRDGGTSVAFLTRRLDALRGRGRAGVAHLDRVLPDSGGTNALERRFLKLCGDAGIERPACQVLHARGGVTMARVDFDFRPSPVVVEVEGQVAHASPSQRQRDAQRRRELHHLGRVVVSFTYEDVFRRPVVVIGDLRRALAAPVPVTSPTSKSRSGVTRTPGGRRASQA